MQLFKAACPRGVVRAFSDQLSSFASEFNKVLQTVLVVLQAAALRREGIAPVAPGPIAASILCIQQVFTSSATPPLQPLPCYPCPAG